MVFFALRVFQRSGISSERLPQLLDPIFGEVWLKFSLSARGVGISERRRLFLDLLKTSSKFCDELVLIQRRLSRNSGIRWSLLLFVPFTSLLAFLGTHIWLICAWLLMILGLGEGVISLLHLLIARHEAELFMDKLWGIDIYSTIAKLTSEVVRIHLCSFTLILVITGSLNFILLFIGWDWCVILLLLSFECLRFGSHVLHSFASLSSLIGLATFACVPINWGFVSRSCLFEFLPFIFDVVNQLICRQITNVFLA